MIDLSWDIKIFFSKSRNKLISLASLYFVQGLPFGFFMQSLPAILREQKVSLSVIGFLYALEIPWVLKPLWASFIDNNKITNLSPNHWKSWIIPAQVGLILVLLGMSFMDVNIQFSYILVGVFIASFFAATQDIATDGFAVTSLSKAETGTANAIQVAFYRFGMLIGGGAILSMYSKIGWSKSMMILSGLLTLMLLPILINSQKSNQEKVILTKSSFSNSLNYYFGKTQYFWIVALFLYKAGDWLAGAMLRPLMVDKGFKVEDIGWIIGTVGFSMGIIGAFIGGLFISKFDYKRTVFVFGVLQCISVVGYAVLYVLPKSFELAYITCMIEHFCAGGAMTAIFAAMMKKSRQEFAATDYSVQSSVIGLAAIGTSILAGIITEKFGYLTNFAVATVLGIVGIYLISRIKIE